MSSYLAYRERPWEREQAERWRIRLNDCRFRWGAAERSQVVHPHYGALVVPHRSNFAAVCCAAEVWRCRSWAELTEEAAVTYVPAGTEAVCMPAWLASELKAIERILEKEEPMANRIRSALAGGGRIVMEINCLYSGDVDLIAHEIYRVDTWQRKRIPGSVLDAAEDPDGLLRAELEQLVREAHLRWEARREDAEAQ